MFSLQTTYTTTVCRRHRFRTTFSHVVVGVTIVAGFGLEFFGKPFLSNVVTVVATTRC